LHLLRGELEVEASVESVEVKVSLEVVESCRSRGLRLSEGGRGLLRSSEGGARLLLRSKGRVKRLLLGLSSLLEGEGGVNSLLLLLRHKC
jgi:hypothetical protein